MAAIRSIAASVILWVANPGLHGPAPAGWHRRAGGQHLADVEVGHRRSLIAASTPVALVGVVTKNAAAEPEA
jgi:hypothetical protein